MWNKLNKEKSHKSKRSLLAELVDCDAIIDKGEGENNVVNKRTEVVNLLQEVEKKNSLEVAQKAKIKWAIEGDENFKYYHGVINKKRNQLSIRGILVEDTWIDSPSLVKISKEEIKKAVWDCGIDKSLARMDLRLVFIVVQWCTKKKKQSLVFKVDFKKAYDSVSWDHLDDIMRKFGFGEKWCMWIESCLRSSRGSVIVNGSPTEEFQFYKGLKQGDLLSHFLFILVMESLHISFQRVVDVGLFKGIELAPSLNLSHMFYVDDVIFMGQWSESNIDTIVKVLDCFNRASSLRINMTKRSKVGGCMPRIQSWNETIKRMACRLSKWKLKTLSIGGARMESMRSHFFNGAELSSKKSVLVKWKHALAFKDKGGLGLDIIYEVEIFKSRGIDLFVSFTRRRAMGPTRLFGRWLDAGDHRLNPFFPRLYALETQKKIDVASKFSHSGLDVLFRRPPRGGVELQQFEHMKEKVEGFILADMMDRWFWALKGSSEFTIMSVRKMIDDFMLPEVSSKTRWIKAVPIKVNVHA
nr:RNA-directed DNA polymerase, eukaryota, reverse transcriptase zinc-binding domain protein [Tanacetum cinerariifolium]GEW67328.1 RNA-directed DNA polymerase, eukaryota, reverse transcriptase zinc-binding domain protein [Tanacetum cinerariifolium]